MGSTCFSARGSKWTGRQHLLIFSRQSCLVGKDQHRPGSQFSHTHPAIQLGIVTVVTPGTASMDILPSCTPQTPSTNWGVELFVAL